MPRITADADLTLAETALAGLAGPTDLAVRLEEVPLSGMITLKGDLAHPAFAAAFEAELSVEAPEVRKASLSEDGDHGVLWMAPDEVLALCDYAGTAALAERFSGALANAGPHLVEIVSDARSRFRLTGEGAREVLAKGAPVDLHPSAFGVGDLRRTRLAQVAVGFWQSDDAPEVFDLVCFRSYASYVWAWLKDAAEPGSLPGVLR